MDDADYLRQRIEAEQAAAMNASCDAARVSHQRLSRLLEERLGSLAPPKGNRRDQSHDFPRLAEPREV